MRLIFSYGRDKALTAGELDRPMSGIRAAALGLCAALARLGHEVHIVACCPNPGRYGGVAFHDRHEFAALASNGSADALIVIPELLPLLMPVRTRARVVWSGNAYPAGDTALEFLWNRDADQERLKVRLYPITMLWPVADRIVVGSRWHADYLEEELGLPAHVIRTSWLGIPLEHYRGPAPERIRRRLVYTSQARRGLPRLLELFPRIRAAVPDAELHVFGYEYRSDASPNAMSQGVQPGVHWRGRVRKSELAQELRSAAVLAYPSRFRETFCLAVAEAQAAGLPVVTSDLAALPERVRDGVHGFLVRGRPKKPAYADSFVARVVQLLRDDGLWVRMGEAAVRHAFRSYDWDKIAADWIADLEQLTAGREPDLPSIDRGLDLLAPSLLSTTGGEQIPADVAAEELRRSWSSYGYDPDSVPGLSRGLSRPTADATRGWPGR